MASRKTELMADSLARVSAAARDNIARSSDIRRTDRERLTAGGYLQGIIKGWYLLTTPEAGPGDSTAWFGSYWTFIGRYLNDRFGPTYCLGAEASLELHLGATTLPRQVTVITRHGGQSVLELPHGVSLVTYQDPDNLPDEDEVVVFCHDTVRAMSLPMALARLAPSFFERRPRDVEIAFRMLPTPLDLARVLVKGGYGAAAERAIGGYRLLDLPEAADEVASEMRMAGHRLNPANPFEPAYGASLPGLHVTSPHTARIRALWQALREPVIEVFPSSPGLPSDPGGYLHEVEEQYDSDAYNSLSIEGYRVTPELIEQMRSGLTPALDEAGERSRSAAFAARGYARAFSLVQQGIGQVLDRESPGLVVAEHLHAWFRALFSPNVEAGALEEHDLIGYRRQPVYIKGSMHVPPPGNAVPDCMAGFLDLLHKEEDPAARSVLGHFMFVYIHPYMDGNGRLARFLMNTMLASGGYPWTVIPLTQRTEYMASLEAASVRADIVPFARFLGALVTANG